MKASPRNTVLSPLADPTTYLFASETKRSAVLKCFICSFGPPKSTFLTIFLTLDTHVDDPTLLASLAKRYVVWSAQRA